MEDISDLQAYYRQCVDGIRSKKPKETRTLDLPDGWEFVRCEDGQVIIREKVKPFPALFRGQKWRRTELLPRFRWGSKKNRSHFDSCLTLGKKRYGLTISAAETVRDMIATFRSAARLWAANELYMVDLLEEEASAVKTLLSDGWDHEVVIGSSRNTYPYAYTCSYKRRNKLVEIDCEDGFFPEPENRCKMRELLTALRDRPRCEGLDTGFVVLKQE